LVSEKNQSPKDSRLVAVALDDKMIYAFFVLAHSLLSTSSKPFNLLVGYFSGHLKPSHQKKIKDFANLIGLGLTMIELSPNPEFTERRHLTITTFSKFVIADKIPAPHLWLDLDTIARSGWDELFDHLEKAPNSKKLVVAKKLESPQTRFEGFNAGVLGWTNQPRAEWITALRLLPEKRFSSEQFLFNKLYSGFTHTVEAKFNFLSSWHALTIELSKSIIIHYSGPVKPWHLIDRHRGAWTKINSSWDFWFTAESALLRDPKVRPALYDLHNLRRRALFSGRLHTGKGALAGWVLRILAVLGPLGVPAVWAMQRRKSL